MRLSSSVRASLGGACHALGGVWLVAGVLRLIFGVAVTFPLLPPVDLQRVVPGVALAVGGAFVAIGAWLTRSARASAGSPSPAPLASHGHAELPAGAPPWTATTRKEGTRVGVPTPPA
jgi:hypothetical protein